MQRKLGYYWYFGKKKKTNWKQTDFISHIKETLNITSIIQLSTYWRYSMWNVFHEKWPHTKALLLPVNLCISQPIRSCSTTLHWMLTQIALYIQNLLKLNFWVKKAYTLAIAAWLLSYKWTYIHGINIYQPHVTINILFI